MSYRSIQVPQRQKKRMTQMAAMRSGGRPAVSTTLWVPSCDSRASIYSANSRLASLAALSSTLYWTEQCNNEITCFIFNFCLFSDLIDFFCLFVFFPFIFPQCRPDESGSWPWVSPSDGGLGDPRFRYCLTSLNIPRRCIGLSRRRVARGGRWVQSGCLLQSLWGSCMCWSFG